MNKLITIMLSAVLFGVVFQSCKSEPEAKDETKVVQEIAEKYMKASANQDFNAMRSIGTAATKTMVNQIEAISTSGLIPESETEKIREAQANATINFISTNVNGNECEIIFNTSAEGKNDTINLLKEGENWLVNMAIEENATEEPAPAE